MSRFTDDAWQRNLPLFNATLALPFNQELAAGTLSQAAFRHYMIQDAHYLVAFGRALAAAAAKAHDAEGVVQFANCAHEAVVVERQLHDGFMREYAISAEEFASTPLSPVCHHYCHFLQSVAWSQPYPIALAALLPCFWIYAEVGRAILAQAAPNNPYQSWIDTSPGKTSTPWCARYAPPSTPWPKRPMRAPWLPCTRPIPTPRAWSGCSGTAPIVWARGRAEGLLIGNKSSRNNLPSHQIIVRKWLI